MVKKKGIEEEIKLLKTRVLEGKAIVGTERVIKGIRNGSLKKIYLANNCPAKLRDDVVHYANLTGVPIVDLGYSNEEIGIFCKKNFLVSVLGLTEE
ncbi:MAG: ribosomal L7Ae/L30e/S12e/Gadd45 family protein [Candidatus Woesearchaeota archaeon]|jgi:large subunit ribosomal protein L30e